MSADTPTLFDQPQTQTRRHNRDPLLAAQEWVAANPGPWRSIIWHAEADIAAGRRPRMKRYVETFRDSDDVNRPGAHRFKIDNTCAAGLVRVLAQKRPELAAHFSQRASRADL